MAESVDQGFAMMAITPEEQLRGWLAQIHREQDVVRQILACMELSDLIEFFGYWTFLPFDAPAARRSTAYRKQKIKTGTIDLKIAFIRGDDHRRSADPIFCF